MCSHCLRASCDLGASRGKSVQRLHGDRKSCNLSGVAVQSPQHPDSNCTEPVRLPCRGCAEMVRHRAVFERATYDMSTGYRLTIFQICIYNFPLNKIVEATEPACESVRKSHSRLLPPHGGLAETARKRGYGQDTGSIDPSQAKCELGITTDVNRISIFLNALPWQTDRTCIHVPFCMRFPITSPPKVTSLQIFLSIQVV